MSKAALPWIISLLAVGIAISAHFKSPAPQTSPETGNRLDQALTTSKASPSTIVDIVPSARDRGRADAAADLMPLLVDIQNRLRTMEVRLQAMKPGWENLALRGMVRLTEEELTEVRLRATNPSLAEADRLSAFGILRRQNAIDDTTALSMAQLAQTSADPEVREDLFQGMEGLTNSVLKGPLLAALSTETNPDAREELVEALGGMRAADPEVESWLRHLAQTDESEAVRRQALESLNERLRHMSVESVQELVMQSNLSPQERLAAFEQLGRENARSPEAVQSMVDLYASSEDARIRAEVFSQFDGINDPALRDPLIIGLAEDPDARVRREAADALGAFASDPDVKAWLEYVAANDQDPGVRREASQALRSNGEDRRGRR